MGKLGYAHRKSLKPLGKVVCRGLPFERGVHRQHNLVDPALRHLLAMRARRRALLLSPRRMALDYLDIYRRLLLDSGAPSAREVTTCVS